MKIYFALLAVVAALVSLPTAHSQQEPETQELRPHAVNSVESRARIAPTEASEDRMTRYEPGRNVLTPAPQAFTPPASIPYPPYPTHFRQSSPQQTKIDQLRTEIFNDPDEEQREDRLTQLKTLLEESFDEGMKAQGEELKELEARVAQLKKAYERRSTNRERIIENYVDSVRLQAEGLTIPALGAPVLRRLYTRPQSQPWRGTVFGEERPEEVPVPGARPAVQPRRQLPSISPNLTSTPDTSF